MRIDVIGLGADGPVGLSEQTRDLIERADLIIGGTRHLAMLGERDVEMHAWARPLTDTFPLIEGHQRSVILTTGDPMWFGIARKMIAHFGADKIHIHSHLSSFQIACARLRWSLPDIECMTCHGRPLESLAKYIAPRAKILVLTDDDKAPHAIKAWLDVHGYALRSMQVLEALGGDKERISDYSADDRYDPLNIVALTCADDTGFLGRSAGLDDDRFDHDGKMTKSEVRAITIGKLMPHRGGVLWDIGAGSGSISLEWLRFAIDGQAHAIEPRLERIERIKTNASRLGSSGLHIHEAAAPGCFDQLPPPDAIFIGGGLTEPKIIEQALERLGTGGRLVANAVTLEGEAQLLDAFGHFGGGIVKIAVNRASKVGPYHGWRPLMPVTQWSFLKR